MISKLAQALIARVCHDLAAPLGSLGLSLEMLESSRMKDDGTFSIIVESYQSLKLKLELFRDLFGNIGNENKPHLSESLPKFKIFLQQKKIALTYDNQVLSGDNARIILCLLLIIPDLYQGGGVCEILVNELSLKLSCPPEEQINLTKYIENPSLSEIGPKNSVALFTSLYTKSLGKKIEYIKEKNLLKLVS